MTSGGVPKAHFIIVSSSYPEFYFCGTSSDTSYISPY